MAQLLDIFGFLSVLLRGLTLAFEALTVGGMVFLFAIARARTAGFPTEGPVRWLRIAAFMLAAVQSCYAAANGAILIGSTELTWSDVAGAGFCIAAALNVIGALAVALFAHSRVRAIVLPLASVLIISGSIMASHSAARINHRSLLMAITAAHHVGTAAWIGAMPYLLIALRSCSLEEGAAATRRFSRIAMASVAVLVAAGAALSYSYVGSGAALTGTTYGVMLLSKITMTALLLGLGALNFKIVREARAGAPIEFAFLRRYAEVEVGIGFTVILAAASLTSTPPAIDVQADRVHAPEIAKRMKPQWPRMETPAFEELSPATPLRNSLQSSAPGSFVPGQVLRPDTPADTAWSEFNHHWAGVIVLAIGAASLVAVRFAWARAWPLLFLTLALFLLIRADSENWPLGPRGFWESFQVAEVAQHRVFVVLIVAFAIFEWRVQSGRLSPWRAGLVFPLVCAVGGALLLTHSHSLGNVKEEFLAELSHVPLAILAVIAGWSRWLEIRLAKGRGSAFKWIWPVCFLVIGSILLNYRES